MKFPQNTKAIIFDLDGVLVDSEPIWGKSFPIMMKRYGLKPPPATHSKLIGMGLRQVIEYWKDNLGLSGDTEELLEEYRQIFYNLLFKNHNLKLLSGADTLLKRLNKKYKLAVATGGHTKQNCSQILKNVGIEEYFDVVVSSDDVKEGKPAPDVYLETARQLTVMPNQCVVVEDAVNGVLSAKAAGMFTIGISSDQDARNNLKKASADVVYKSLSEVEIP